MAKEFNEILDECISRMNRGEKLDSCLADYPEQADQLKPLLLAMTRVRQTLSFTPSDSAVRAGRARLYDALEKKHQPSFWQKISGNRPLWVTAAVVLVVALISYFALQNLGAPGITPGGGIVQPSPSISPVPASSPTSGPTSGPTTTEPPTQYIASANPKGNFIFLVSDEVNDIADFSSVNLVVERIGILQDGDSGKWLEFTPVIKEFDLSLLPGDKSLELWRGDIPAGQYNKVFVEVSQVTGVLKDTQDSIEIKLPSSKLQMSLQFEVGADVVTSFTYDLTVVKTGNDKNGGKYILKPQIGESGTSQSKY